MATSPLIISEKIALHTDKVIVACARLSVSGGKQKKEGEQWKSSFSDYLGAWNGLG